MSRRNTTLDEAGQIPESPAKKAAQYAPHDATEEVRPDVSLDNERPDSLIESNAVDEASWESFPASDPPAFNTGGTC